MTEPTFEELVTPILLSETPLPLDIINMITAMAHPPATFIEDATWANGSTEFEIAKGTYTSQLKGFRCSVQNENRVDIRINGKLYPYRIVRKYANGDEYVDLKGKGIIQASSFDRHYSY